MGQAFDALAGAGLIPSDLVRRLKKAVGFRNLAVHDYGAIDWHIVHGICRNNLEVGRVSDSVTRQFQAPMSGYAIKPLTRPTTNPESPQSTPCASTTSKPKPSATTFTDI